MKYKKRFGFVSQVLVMCFLVFLLGIWFVFYTIYDAELNGKIVDCKDREGNKILNQECIVENSFDTEEEKIIHYIIAGIVFITGSLALITLIIREKEDGF